MKCFWSFAVLVNLTAAAAAADPPPTPSPTLTLTKYLDQVRAKNPAAQAAQASVTAAEAHLNFAETSFMSEFYAKYSIFDQRELPTNPLAPPESRGRNWKLGVRDQTKFGLQADAYFSSNRTELLGVNPFYLPINDYEQSVLGLQLTQSLWRNGFGETSKATFDRQKSMDRTDLLRAQFELKNLLLKAENTYWSLVSYNEVIKLQGENVERARRLRDHMQKSAEMRLFDDVDAMQTEASFEQRDLERLTSMNERASLIRDFNTLRGSTDEQLESLEDLPAQAIFLKTVRDPSQRMSREDFRITAEQATQLDESAKGAISQLHPQLDLVGGISANGLDNRAASAQHQALHLQHPDWNVGVVFSIPLDYSLIRDTMRSYRAQRLAAKATAESARFEEDRAWDALLKNKRESQDIYERSMALEKLETTLVNSERRRLLNGRSTTLQTVTIEQNLALAQISRVRAQLALLQIHNLIKQFGAI